MATVYDVADYILERLGEISAVKLQKLVYYSQAWHLVWDDEPLFGERIEAWVNGPVSPDLYYVHRGHYSVARIPGHLGTANNLSKDQISSIDVILNAYGDKSAQWLSNQTHIESPWREARVGLAENERGNNEITQESMSEYYSSLIE